MKTNNFKFIIAVILLSFGTTGCEGNLDLDPAQAIPVGEAISTEENIENILIGTYAEAGQAASYGGRLQMMADLYGFTNEVRWRGTFGQPRQVFNKSIFVDNSFVAGLWLNGYEVINQANLVLDNINLIQGQERSDNVTGQALFLRGLAYFDLVRFFGSPYIAGQNNSQLGVPITLQGVIDYDADLEIPRNTVEEVYAQVINDLTQAYQLLPSSNEFFADKYSAQALLARVYLQQGNYVGARDAADDVIANSGHTLTSEFGFAFNNSADSNEDVFAFQVTKQSGTNQLVVHYASEGNGGRGGDIQIQSAFLAKYDSPTDARRGFFYINPDNGRRLTSKYTDQFGNIPFIRLAEMHLTRAEANLAEGTTVGATPLADVNTVRARANALSLTTVTLQDVWKERELELAFEGFLIHDLQRTMRSVGEIPFDADRLTFPIPEREIDVNSLLVQNPGY